jgi:nitroreductase
MSHPRHIPYKRNPYESRSRGKMVGKCVRFRESRDRPQGSCTMRGKENIMDLAQAIRNRRTIRKYLDKDVPEELLVQAFELARWAPSGGNFQSWKFLVVKKPELIRQMADAVQEKVNILANWPEAREFGETTQQYLGNAAFFREAPVLIAALSGKYESIADLILAKRPEGDPLTREMIENRRTAPTSIQQMGGFVAHLLLAFQSVGLGACWMSGPLIAKGEIEEMLEVTEGWNLVAVVPVGFSAESPSAKPRKAVDELVEFVR